MLSGSDKATAKIVRGPQPETAQHYRVMVNGKLLVEETFNYLRKRVHPVHSSEPVRVVELEILSTHGVPEARVFDVRLLAREKP